MSHPQRVRVRHSVDMHKGASMSQRQIGFQSVVTRHAGCSCNSSSNSSFHLSAPHIFQVHAANISKRVGYLCLGFYSLFCEKNIQLLAEN